MNYYFKGTFKSMDVQSSIHLLSILSSTYLLAFIHPLYVEGILKAKSIRMQRQFITAIKMLGAYLVHSAGMQNDVYFNIGKLMRGLWKFCYERKERLRPVPLPHHKTAAVLGLELYSEVQLDLKNKFQGLEGCLNNYEHGLLFQNDPVSVPSTHIAAPNYLDLHPVQEIQHPHTDNHAGKTTVHIK